jgi:hypothetical protein
MPAERATYFAIDPGAVKIRLCTDDKGISLEIEAQRGADQKTL